MAVQRKVDSILEINRRKSQEEQLRQSVDLALVDLDFRLMMIEVGMTGLGGGEEK